MLRIGAPPQTPILTCDVFVEPPSFSKRVESVTAVLGNAVKLQGSLKGSAPITVKWMKDSEILRDDDPNIKMVFENNVASLSITAVAISHGGKYSCQAENEAGQQKCEATLTVQGQRRSLMQMSLYKGPKLFLLITTKSVSHQNLLEL